MNRVLDEITNIKSSRRLASIWQAEGGHCPAKFIGGYSNVRGNINPNDNEEVS